MTTHPTLQISALKVYPLWRSLKLVAIMTSGAMYASNAKANKHSVSLITFGSYLTQSSSEFIGEQGIIFALFTFELDRRAKIA
jgi:hypothetical protein